ncbi:MAG: hypothetical protein JXA67_14765 [Micromonosporaceae bacterium]|nr:hypothetical protein [Micromonosporaceae bacterium]
MLPTVPTSTDQASKKTPIVLDDGDFSARDFADAGDARCDLARILATITHRYLDAPAGGEDLASTTDEINLLRNACQVLDAAIWETRHRLRLIERRARRRAARRVLASQPPAGAGA